MRGKFAILHNFTFLSACINLKVIFKIKKIPQKDIISAASYCERKRKKERRGRRKTIYSVVMTSVKLHIIINYFEICVV